HRRGRLPGSAVRRQARTRRVCHVTSPSVMDGGPTPGRSGDWYPARSMAAGTGAHIQNAWIGHRVARRPAAVNGIRSRSAPLIKADGTIPRRTVLPTINTSGAADRFPDTRKALRDPQAAERP
ncbi:hypothetical protein MHW47_26580, partial [Streptomyces sp. OfavH-34-F]|uniref:hypothetical protein n=1 Tax=Streptomyces sp. OfavH-34-F TaxID=2917760 RepID=UPI001EF17784